LGGGWGPQKGKQNGEGKGKGEHGRGREKGGSERNGKEGERRGGEGRETEGKGVCPSNFFPVPANFLIPGVAPGPDTVLPDTANLAQHPISGCCYLAWGVLGSQGDMNPQ